MNNTLHFAETLARQAGSLLTEFFQLNGIESTQKADHTVVTQADLAADDLIRSAIQAAYPEDQILTEESGITQYRPDRPMWIIDPLDGTTNFSLGLHTWGVSIARLVDGYPDIAAIYFPLYSELYTAKRGEGAFLNQQPLQIDPQNAQRTTAFFACCSRTFRRYQVGVRYKTRILGAAAYDFCCVARGAAIAGFQVTPKIWDIAGGWLVLEEAGGSAQLHGGGSPFPYTVMEGFERISYPTVMAANASLGEKVRSQLIPRDASA